MSMLRSIEVVESSRNLLWAPRLFKDKDNTTLIARHVHPFKVSAHAPVVWGAFGDVLIEQLIDLVGGQREQAVAVAEARGRLHLGATDLVVDHAGQHEVGDQTDQGEGQRALDAFQPLGEAELFLAEVHLLQINPNPHINS